MFLSSTFGATVLAAALVSLAAAAGGSGEVYATAFWALAIVLGSAGLLLLAVACGHAQGPLGLLIGCSIVQYGITIVNCWTVQTLTLGAYWRQVGAGRDCGALHPQQLSPAFWHAVWWRRSTHARPLLLLPAVGGGRNHLCRPGSYGVCGGGRLHRVRPVGA